MYWNGSKKKTDNIITRRNSEFASKQLEKDEQLLNQGIINNLRNILFILDSDNEAEVKDSQIQRSSGVRMSR